MADVPVLKRLLLVSILVGLALSVYAALETELLSLQGTCYVNAFFQCGAVAESAYSHIGPIPVWTIGVGGFVVLLGLGILYFRQDEPRWLFWIWTLAAIGLASSVVLLLVEVLLIQAICPVCLASYAADLAVLLVAWRLRKERATAPSSGAAA